MRYGHIPRRLLGPSTEESLRPQIPVHKKKKRKNKKLDREGRRQKEAEEANQVKSNLRNTSSRCATISTHLLSLEPAEV